MVTRLEDSSISVWVGVWFEISRCRSVSFLAADDVLRETIRGVVVGIAIPSLGMYFSVNCSSVVVHDLEDGRVDGLDPVEHLQDKKPLYNPVELSPSQLCKTMQFM